MAVVMFFAQLLSGVITDDHTNKPRFVEVDYTQSYIFAPVSEQAWIWDGVLAGGNDPPASAVS